jgi:hypothetical protein
MYPVQYEADYVEQRSRLTTFFRLFTAIPAMVLTFFYVLAAEVVVFLAWFVLLFTGRWPEGMYRFVAGAVRNASRLQAYYVLLTDKYPPWNGEEDPGYPIRVNIAPPKEQYSRMKVLFRIFLLIPVYIIQYVYNIMMEVGAFCSWVVIVITGKQPEGLQNFINMSMRYHVDALAYQFLLTEDFPPITVDSRPASIAPAPTAGAVGGGVADTPETPTYQPPSSPGQP